MTVALCLGAVLGLSACSLEHPDPSTNGSSTPIVSSFGKVALVEYVDNNTLFLDYDGEHSYTYDKIVDRQLTAMAEDITSRLWTVYGNQNNNITGITINDSLKNNNTFLTETISGIVVDNATKYFGEEESGKAPINVGKKEDIKYTQGGSFEGTITKNVYYDVQVDSKSGNVTIKDFGDGNTEYQKYNHYYIDEQKEENSSHKYHYGVVFEGNYASLFNNLSNLLYHMNNEYLADTEEAKGTIVHTDLPKSGEENNYNLTNVLNFKDTINGGPRWAVVAKWNDGTIKDEDVIEGGAHEGEDPRSDDYYQFFFYFNSNNEYKNKADFETAVKAKFQQENEQHDSFNATFDQLIITEQPAWEIAKNTPITKQDQLTKVIKKYLASIIVAGGVDNLYLQDDVTSDTTDAIYNSRIQNITYTANWLELYYDDILNVIKQKIIGDELWGSDAGYGSYLQGLSDDLYEMVVNNPILDVIEVFWNQKLRIPLFEYFVDNTDYIEIFLDLLKNKQTSNIYLVGEDKSQKWEYIKPFLTQYLIARNYQGYDLLVPTLLRSCAQHAYSSTQEGENVIENRWFVSSKSGMTVYSSPDDFAGNSAEIKPAKNYKSVIFFAKEATDLSKYSVMVFFGNVQQAFAVRPIITLVNGNGTTKNITTLTSEDYTISAQDKEYLNGDKESGKYVVKADHEYTGYEEASFFIEFSRGNIVGPGSYAATSNPSIADNDWVLQPEYKGENLVSVDTILNGYNYIQISFEQYDLSGNLLTEKVPYGVLIDIVD